MPIHDQVSGKVIGSAFKVHNQLGFGFLESVYEKALSIELVKVKLKHECQVPVQVFYDNYVVGNFVCDILVEGRMIVELKSVSQLVVAHEVQLVNYLNATRLNDGLLLNFGPSKVEIKRKARNLP